jgi:hypothetical protein
MMIFEKDGAMRVHEKLYWDKRQNPLTSEKVLREYSESLNPLKLFVSHSSASLNNKPMFLPFTYSNDNRNN